MTDNKICYELKIEIPEEQKDLLTALLLELGENNFVEGALDCDVEFDFDYEHFQRDYYGEYAKNLPVIVYDEDLQKLQTLKTNLIKFAPTHSLKLEDEKISIAPIKDQNWRESWKASFKPVDVDGVCVVLPPWEDVEKFNHKYKIVIDPGMAFGTGQHETTRLCLKLFYALPSLPKTVFDVGTGSGILAIAARMHGTQYALGCDIDEPSIQIAQENAEKNGTPDVAFTVTPISEIKESDFELVFANIQSRPLLKIFPDILRHTAKGGNIIVSGILAVEFEDFEKFLNSLDVEVTKLERLNDWVGFVCKRKA